MGLSCVCSVGNKEFARKTGFLESTGPPGVIHNIKRLQSNELQLLQNWNLKSQAELDTLPREKIMKLANRIMLRKKMQQEKNSEQLQQDQNTGVVTLDDHGREGDYNRLADDYTLLHHAQGKDLAQRSCKTCSVLHPFDPTKLKPGDRYIGVFTLRKSAAEGCELCLILLEVATYKVEYVSHLKFSFQYGYLAAVASWDKEKFPQKEYCVSLHTLPGKTVSTILQ